MTFAGLLFYAHRINKYRGISIT